jgi:hypothetical protein
MLSLLLSHDSSLSVYFALASNYIYAAQIARHDGHGSFCRIYIASALLYVLLVVLHMLPAMLSQHYAKWRQRKRSGPQMIAGRLHFSRMTGQTLSSSSE